MPYHTRSATGELVTGRGSLQTYADGVEMAGLLYISPTLGSTAAERFFALSIAAARKTRRSDIR